MSLKELEKKLIKIEQELSLIDKKIIDEKLHSLKKEKKGKDFVQKWTELGIKVQNAWDNVSLAEELRFQRGEEINSKIKRN